MRFSPGCRAPAVPDIEKPMSDGSGTLRLARRPAGARWRSCPPPRPSAPLDGMSTKALLALKEMLEDDIELVAAEVLEE
jgi:hypothetical protein